MGQRVGRGVRSARRGVRSAVAAFVACVLSMVAISLSFESAAAVAPSDWNPGYIISDSLFYQPDAMSAAGIQSFLDSKIGACQNGACLNVVSFSWGGTRDVVSSSTGNLRCAAVPAGTYTAAAFIYQVQVSCGISAKVILVTLQKEQGLVTKSAPSQSALDRAMGMACPDTAPCAASSLGLANQIYQGTMQLNTYRAARFALQPGIRSIQYSPNAACGRATVNVVNYATAALYSYTPYTPDAAAIANLTGIGDSCSAYGNRNFWVYYNSWFGSSVGQLPTLTANAGLGEPALYAPAVDQSGNLLAYPETGAGAWGQPGTIGGSWGSISALTSGGDFDGDGHGDLIGRDPFGRLWLYDRDGAGGWRDQGRQIGSGWNQFLFVAGGQDFTDDGRPDVLAVDSAGNLVLFPGNGSGGFSASRIVGSGWGGFDAMIVMHGFFGADESDVVGLTGDGRVLVFGSDGAGGWSRSATPATGWSAYQSIQTAGDFDGDGHADLFAIDSAGALWLYPGTGDGALGPRRQVGSGWNTMSEILPPIDTRVPTGTPAADGAHAGAGDLSGDGIPDLLARDPAGNLTDYPGDGHGGWLTAAPMGTGFGDLVWFGGVGDFQQNGRREFMGVDTSGRLWLYPGRDDSGWRVRHQIGSGWNGLTPLATGDFDGDGIPDLMAKTPDGRLILFPGDGHGAWREPVTVGSGWNGFDAVVAVGDWDGDGHSDLMARRPDGSLWLYPGSGTGGWLAPREIGTGWSGFSMLVGDADRDGDGHVDLLAVAPGGALWLYPGDGHGGWGVPRRVGTGWSSFSQLD